MSEKSTLWLRKRAALRHQSLFQRFFRRFFLISQPFICRRTFPSEVQRRTVDKISRQRFSESHSSQLPPDVEFWKIILHHWEISTDRVTAAFNRTTNFNATQSPYHRHYSTETSRPQTTNADANDNWSRIKTVLAALGISMAFNLFTLDISEAFDMLWYNVSWTQL